MENIRKQELLIFFMAQIHAICSAGDSFQYLQKNGNLQFANFIEKISGSVLLKNQTVLSRLEVTDKSECQSKCVANSRCLSVNFGIDVTKKGRVQCELLNWGGTDYRSYLIRKQNFFHSRMMTICSTNPCGTTTYCIPLPGDDEKPFTCLCPQKSPECINGNIKCNALGIEAGHVSDAQMTASSSYSNNWSAHKARLNKNANWVPRGEEGAKRVSWLQVDLKRTTRLTGVATQGRHDSITRWTKTYQLNYSDSGILWTTYREDGAVKTFQGNINNNGIVKHELRESFVSRMVRIVPKSWLGSPALRIELYGC